MCVCSVQCVSNYLESCGEGERKIIFHHVVMLIHHVSASNGHAIFSIRY